MSVLTAHLQGEAWLTGLAQTPLVQFVVDCTTSCMTNPQQVHN